MDRTLLTSCLTLHLTWLETNCLLTPSSFGLFCRLFFWIEVSLTLLESLLSIEQYSSCKVALQLALFCSLTLLQLINSGQGADMVIKGQIQQAGDHKWYMNSLAENGDHWANSGGEKKAFRKINVMLSHIHMPIFKQLSLLPVDKAAGWRTQLK